MQGMDFDRVVKEADKGVVLCDSFTYAPLKAECDRMVTEFKGISLKAKARK